MPPKKKTSARKKATRKAAKPVARKSSKFVCPTCGFKAAHAMGLGRHRSARHGVISKAKQTPLGLESRVVRLERRVDALLDALKAATATGRRG